MALDFAVLAVLVVAAVGGAVSGALRQVVQLAAVAVGWLAARQFGAAVAEGFGRSMPGLLARPAASVLLFLGGAALAGFAGNVLLKARGVSRAVRGPADRAAGALLGGAKGALVMWVILSAATLAGEFRIGRFKFDPARSDFAGFAREHNLLVRVDAKKARTLERILKAARDPIEAPLLERDPDARKLLEDPRVRALVGGLADGWSPNAAETEKLLADPEVAQLLARLREKVDGLSPPKLP